MAYNSTSKKAKSRRGLSSAADRQTERDCLQKAGRRAQSTQLLRLLGRAGGTAEWHGSCCSSSSRQQASRRAQSTQLLRLLGRAEGTAEWHGSCSSSSSRQKAIRRAQSTQLALLASFGPCRRYRRMAQQQHSSSSSSSILLALRRTMCGRGITAPNFLGVPHSGELYTPPEQQISTQHTWYCTL